MTDSEGRTKYYIRSRGKIMGPFTIERLKTLQTRGQFSRVHEVSEDRKSWRPAASIDGLFETQLIGRKQPSLLEDGLEAMELTADNPTAIVPPTNGQASWYYHLAGEQHGPVPLGELRSLVRGGRLHTDDLVWNDSLSDWMPLGEVDELATEARVSSVASARPVAPGARQMFCFSCGTTINERAEICPQCGVRQHGASGDRRKSRLVTALLALFLGWLGVHRFYLEQVAIGLLYLLYSLVILPAFSVAVLFLGLGFPILGWSLSATLPFLALIPGLVTFVEFVVFLCMSDRSFDTKYNRRH